MGDWTTTTNKREKKFHCDVVKEVPRAKRVFSNIYNKNGTPVIRIDVSEFNRLKDKYTFVSHELSQKFDEINEMFKKSSHYINTKQKINYNQHNQNKWQKMNIASDVDKIIITFNKITESNYKSIINELKTLNVVTNKDLQNIVLHLFKRCIINYDNIKVFAMLIKDIMLELSWIVYDDNTKPISFRKVFIDNLEINFNAILSNKALSTDDVLSKNNNSKNVFFTLISLLFDNMVIGNQLFRYIFNNIENNFLSTNNSNFIDYWLIMYKYASKHWTDTLKIYLEEKQLFIVNNYSNFSLRIQILVDEVFGHKCESLNYLKNQKYSNSVVMCINEFSTYFDATEWFEMIENKHIELNEIIDYCINTYNHNNSINNLDVLCAVLTMYPNHEYLSESLKVFIPTIKNDLSKKSLQPYYKKFTEFM